jgi:hypothetical protein
MAAVETTIVAASSSAAYAALQQPEPIRASTQTLTIEQLAEYADKLGLVLKPKPRPRKAAQ